MGYFQGRLYLWVEGSLTDRTCVDERILTRSSPSMGTPTEHGYVFIYPRGDSGVVGSGAPVSPGSSYRS